MVLTPSTFFPIAVGFFGLGVGYFVWGGQGLFGIPKASPEVDRTMGSWGIWMPGFLQFITGTYLLVGLTWFPVFAKAPPLYMAGVAFTAFGVHWFVLGRRRQQGWSSAPDGWMAIPFFLLSILGLLVFAGAKDIPVVILFIILALIYLFEFFARLFDVAGAGKLVSLCQFLGGIWLMYLTFGVTFNMALGYHWWV